MPHPNLLVDEINCLNARDPDPRAMKHFSQRLHNVRDGYIAAGDFVEHWCEENKILLGNEPQFHLRRVAKPLLKLHRGVSPGEPASENQNDSLRRVLSPGQAWKTW